MQISGIPASPGIAIGPVQIAAPQRLAIPRYLIAPDQAIAEWERLEVALHSARGQIADLRDAVARRTGTDEAAIFDAHLLILEDVQVLDSARAACFNQHQNAEAAFWDAMMIYHDMLLSIDDEYLRARAADLKDVAYRVIVCLRGEEVVSLKEAAAPRIIVARELLPSDTAGLDPALTLGLVTELGGPTAHVAILARQLNIPAVVGATGAVEAITAAQSAARGPVLLAINGGTGSIEVDPDESVIAHFQTQHAAFTHRQAKLVHLHALPCVTLDGHPIELGANIGHPRDAEAAARSGAHGIGLFRTEFLFFDRTAAPAEDEQMQAYLEASRHFPQGSVIVRTLDIGGDKTLPYLELPHEENPFLGMRGLRLCLHPTYQPLFATQLRALLRAIKAGAHLQIMFPMVNTVEELQSARLMIRRHAEALDMTNAYDRLSIGAMVETPAAAATTDLLASAADFFSIGTNDLTQYILAVDRMNTSVAAAYSPFSPAVLRTLYVAINGAHQHGRKIGMCGEFAGDPRATLLLLAIGLDEFSMTANAIPEVKQIIRQSTLAHAKSVMQLAYRLESVNDVIEVLTAARDEILAS